MAAKIRRPGAGRKPAGPIRGKISTFSTRITEDTRAELEAEAAMSGQSISQAAERLIQLGIQLKREKDIDDPIRALTHLLGALAYNCSFVDQTDKVCEWTNDAFVYDAFVRATCLLLERLRPSSEIVPPTEMNGLATSKTPQDHAEQAFAIVWRALQTSEPKSPQSIKAEHSDLGWRPYPEVTVGAMSRATYTMDQIKRALGIKGRK